MLFLHFFVYCVLSRGTIPFVGGCGGQSLYLVVGVLGDSRWVYFVGMSRVQMFVWRVPCCTLFGRTGRFLRVKTLARRFLRVGGSRVVFVRVLFVAV